MKSLADRKSKTEYKEEDTASFHYKVDFENLFFEETAAFCDCKRKIFTVIQYHATQIVCDKGLQNPKIYVNELRENELQEVNENPSELTIPSVFYNPYYNNRMERRRLQPVGSKEVQKIDRDEALSYIKDVGSPFNNMDYFEHYIDGSPSSAQSVNVLG
ncbi:hypothetical protein ACTXT7_008656 [Hymenolepis weldensis]